MMSPLRIANPAIASHQTCAWSSPVLTCASSLLYAGYRSSPPSSPTEMITMIIDSLSSHLDVATFLSPVITMMQCWRKRSKLCVTMTANNRSSSSSSSNRCCNHCSKYHLLFNNDHKMKRQREVSKDRVLYMMIMEERLLFFSVVVAAVALEDPRPHPRNHIVVTWVPSILPHNPWPDLLVWETKPPLRKRTRTGTPRLVSNRFRSSPLRQARKHRWRKMVRKRSTTGVQIINPTATWVGRHRTSSWREQGSTREERVTRNFWIFITVKQLQCNYKLH
mmetsp:Transcript_5894/g.17627  ORF Transcript_5894/g.17627 Transcript_5894/m.17627 type:complete len:278 (-) Transcript_5894:1592-2425(-)